MIVTASSQPTSAKATVLNSGKGTILGSAYQGFKIASKTFGFYQDIKPYLPDTAIDRYRYKPHKRITGYLGQAFHSKKIQKRDATCNYFNQKCARCTIWN